MKRETITITKRILKDKEVFNKHFDDYEKGYWGMRISKREYGESKANNPAKYTDELKCLNIVERITYEN